MDRTVYRAGGSASVGDFVTLSSTILRGLAAAILLGVTELLLLPLEAWTGLGPSGALTLVFVFVGNGLLGALGASFILFFLSIFAKSPRLGLTSERKAIAIFTLLTSPYGFWLARYTMSGPQVRDLSYGPWLIAGLFLGFLCGAGVLFWGTLLAEKRTTKAVPFLTLAVVLQTGYT